MKNPLPRRRAVTPREVDQAKRQLQALEAAYDGIPGPTPAARLAEAREHLDGLTARQAEQERAAVAEAIKADLDAAAARLSARVGRINARQAAVAEAVAALAQECADHDTDLAAVHALLAGNGLTARQGDTSGTVGNPFDGLGARVGGTDYMPVDAEQLTAHAVHAVCSRAYGPRSLLARVLGNILRPGLGKRADGLKLASVPPSFTLKAAAPPPWPTTAGSIR